MQIIHAQPDSISVKIKMCQFYFVKTLNECAIDSNYISIYVVCLCCV